MISAQGLLKPSLLLALFAATSSANAAPKTPKPSLSFSHFLEGTGHDLQLRLGSQLKWTALARSPYACLIPAKRAVFYTESYPGSRRTVLRSYEGKLLWTNPETPPEFDDYRDLVAGGDIIFGTPGDAEFEGKSQNDLPAWKKFLKATPVTLMSLKNGDILWKSNRQEIGTPIWSNGQIFYSLRWTYPANGQPVRVYIEERNIANHKLLWKAALNGLPPQQLRVVGAGKGKARLVFSRESRLAKVDFLSSLPKLDITVPVHRGGVPPSWLQARYFEGKA